MSLSARINTLFFSLTASVLFVLFVLGCKPVQNGSDTESIDNAVSSSAEKKKNYCEAGEGNFPEFAYVKAQYASPAHKDSEIASWLKGQVRGDKKDLVQADVKDILKLAPYEISKAFFVARGVIEISGATPIDCIRLSGNAGFASEAGSSAPEVCWSIRGAGDDSYPVIAVGSNLDLKAAVRHGLLRALAMYYSFVMYNENTQRILAENGQAQAAEILARDTARLDRLAAALEVDINRRGEDSSHFAEQKAKPGYKAALFAEAVDSYFCSEKTHLIFKSCYANAYQAFLTGSDQLNLPYDLSACAKAMQ